VDATSLLRRESDTAPIPGLDLFRDVVVKCDSELNDRPLNCPVRANIVQYGDPLVVENWRLLLSSAEIAAGRPLSYRDLWGAIALSLLGPRTGPVEAGSSEIDGLLAQLANATTQQDRLASILQLARFRSHVALFRSPIPRGDGLVASHPPSVPFYGGVSLLDPGAWGTEDSKTVESAMQGLTIGNLPSAQLLTSVPALQNAWSPFDEQLESTIVDAIQSDSYPDSARRKLVSWLSSYLERLTYFATGKLGNAKVVQLWEGCATAARNGTCPLPAELKPSLVGLLFPHDSGIGESLKVRAFAPRMEPLVPSQEEGSFLAESHEFASLRFQVRKSGSRLSLELLLAGGNEVVGDLILDFPLLREALSWQPAQIGQTEATTYVEPRLERCRSACLRQLPATERRLVAILNGSTQELAV
jgi:hypothetical protein